MATFDHVSGWIDGDKCIQARLAVVEHPKLGRQDSVVTSRLAKVVFADDGTPALIETRNTIYIRVGMEHAP